MGITLSTHDVPKKERLDYWNHLVSQKLGRLNMVAAADGTFSGKIIHHQLADLDFVRVASDQLSVLRTEKLIMQETSNYIKVNFHLAGMGQITQNGTSADLKPGDWVVYDNTRPYELTFNGRYEQLLVLVPKHQLVKRVNSLERSLVRTLSSQNGLGKIIADLVKVTLPEIDSLPPLARPQVANSLLDLLASNLGQLGYALVPEPCAETLNVVLIKQHIRQHLASSELSVESIANALHVSKRYLHHVFQNEETSISRYIWQSRVEQCCTELANPINLHRSITDIAFAWGFNSSPHFSRLFKAQIGLSPRAFRNQHLR